MEDKIKEILGQIRELIEDIRGDWNDPRSRCKEALGLLEQIEEAIHNLDNDEDGGETCQLCGRVYASVWKAPDWLWEKVTGKTDGLLCPTCFDRLGRMKKIYIYWSACFEFVQSDTDPCPECGGVGGIFPEGKPSLEDPAKPNELCPTCKGYGYKLLPSGLLQVDCRVCKGTGGVEKATTVKVRRLVELAYKAIDDEEEFDGEMPDELWQLLLRLVKEGGKDAFAEHMRFIVQETKVGIKKRFTDLIRQLNKDNPNIRFEEAE